MISTDVTDNLNFEDDEAIKSIIGEEKIYFSDKVCKKSQGLIGSKKQERNLLITDTAVYNLKEKQLKRRIEIKDLKGITISKLSDQFIIHGNQNEYDYLYSYAERKKIVATLQSLFESITHKDLLFCIKNEKDLEKFLVGKNERKKTPSLFKINPEELMSIREFIDSDGSTNINCHPNSQKLEKEFEKNNKYQEGVTFNDFEIVALIGQGSSANVYLANYNGEEVALKVIDKAYVYKNNCIDKILLEKNILSSFPNESNMLCQMKLCFMTDTKICFVLPFFKGGDLYNFLEKNEKFNEKDTAFYAIQIAKMLSVLHGKNIVYRDLKLENLMLNDNGYLTLIDFGSCKVVEEKTELQTSFEGSIDYLSPEVISGEGHGFMTDWWSYGIVIYELLFGKAPFHEGGTERILDLIVSSNLRFDSKVKLTPSTKEFLNKLLRKNPKERLGQNEYTQVTQHQFFNGVNKDNIVAQKMTAPLMPELGGDSLSNFDGTYYNKGIEDFSESTDAGVLGDIEGLFDCFK